MLQCVAVCCSVLQCIIYVGGSKVVREEQVSCSVLQHVAVFCSVVQCGAVWCSVVQCVALCCTVLHCAALCCTVLQCVAEKQFFIGKCFYMYMSHVTCMDESCHTYE